MRVFLALLLGCLVGLSHAQAPVGRGGKPLQAVNPIGAEDKAKVLAWENVLRARRPQGNSKQAQQKQVDDFTAKQTAVGEIQASSLRVYIAQSLLSTVMDKDEDDKVRTNAAALLLEIVGTFALPANDVDAIALGAFAMIERKGDKAADAMQTQLVEIIQASLAQPQLASPKKKALDERLTQLLNRENLAATASIRENSKRILRIQPSSSATEQREALQAIGQMLKLAGNPNLSPTNRDLMVATMIEALNRRFNQSYHFDQTVKTLEIIGDPKALPALEAFLNAHPSEKINPNVNGFVIGLTKHAIEALKKTKP